MSLGASTEGGSESSLTSIDIGHSVYAAIIDPQTAFWALVDKAQLTNILKGEPQK